MFRDTAFDASIMGGRTVINERIAVDKSTDVLKGSDDRENLAIKEIGDLLVIERRSLIKSRKQIPSDWEVDQYGMILPRCFLSTDTLTRLFTSPLRYLYFLSKKLEGKIDMQQGIKSFVSDKEMRAITGRLSKELFATDQVKSLDFESKIVLARKLRYQYASTIKQVSRMLSLDVRTLSEFI